MEHRYPKLHHPVKALLWKSQVWAHLLLIPPLKLLGEDKALASEIFHIIAISLNVSPQFHQRQVVGFRGKKPNVIELTRKHLCEALFIVFGYASRTFTKSR